jgi:hypothetical protein
VAYYGGSNNARAAAWRRILSRRFADAYGGAPSTRPSQLKELVYATAPVRLPLDDSYRNKQHDLRTEQASLAPLRLSLATFSDIGRVAAVARLSSGIWLNVATMRRYADAGDNFGASDGQHQATRRRHQHGFRCRHPSATLVGGGDLTIKRFGWRCDAISGVIAADVFRVLGCWRVATPAILGTCTLNINNAGMELMGIRTEWWLGGDIHPRGELRTLLSLYDSWCRSLFISSRTTWCSPPAKAPANGGNQPPWRRGVAAVTRRVSIR